jgi:hypothetical protein
MTRFTFEKRLLKKLHGIRELSQQFFKDNPEYDLGEEGYVSMCVYKDSVNGNTSPHRDDHVNVFEEVRG